MNSPSSSSSSRPSRRHGFHLTCKTCTGNTDIGGIEDPKHFAKIVREYRRQHLNHDYELKQSYHAAELGHASQVQNTRQTITSATYSDFTNNSITAASFTGSKKYLISVTAQLDCNSLASAARAQIVHGTTVFTDSVHSMWVQTTPSRATYAWWTVFTQPASPELIKCQISNSNAANTTGIDQFSLVAIKLSDDLTEDTGAGGDWKTNEVSASTTLALTDSTANNATVTITPAVANDHWLVMTKSKLTVAAATRSYASRIVRSGEAASTGPFTVFEGQDAASESWVWTLARVFTLGAASNTFTEKSYSVQGASGTRTYSGVFILNLSKMRNEVDSYDDSAVQDLSATDFATQIRTVSLTPAVQGDVWIYGFVTGDINTGNSYFEARMQIDNTTDVPDTSTTDTYSIMVLTDAGDEPPANLQGMVNMTAAAHTIDIDASVNAAAAGKGIRAKSLFAVTMELPAAGGAALVKFAPDTVTLTEAVNKIKGLSKLPAGTETVPLTEATNMLVNRVRILNESLTLSEQISRAMIQSRVINETVGLTEALTVAQNLRRVLNETVGLTEGGVVAARQLSRVLNEALTLTEAISTSVGKVISINDETVTIQEAINKVLGGFITKTVNETVSLTEAQTIIVRQIVRILDATVGISESINPSLGKAITLNEALAITEAIRKLQEDFDILDYDVNDYDTLEGAAPAPIKHINETVGLSETVNFMRNIVRVINESVTLSEATNRIMNMARVLPAETVGITEAINRLVARTRSVDETVGITEAMNILAGRTRVINEPVELLESINRLSNLSRIVNESITLTETINRLVSRVRTVNESITLGEAYIIARNLLRIQNEQVTINEALAQKGNLVRMLDEAVTILEASQRNLQLSRVVNETLTLTEAISTSLGKVRIINESTTLTEIVQSILTAGGQAFTKFVNENLNISEAINVALGKSKVVNESMSISEGAIVRNMALARMINEDVTLAEALNTAARIVRTINEDIILGEQLTKAQQLVRLINETVNIADSANYVRALTKILNEVVTLSDTQISAIGKVKVITEAITALESIMSVLEEGVAPPAVPPGPSLTMALSTQQRRHFPTVKRLRPKEVKLIEPKQKIKAEPFKPLETKPLKITRVVESSLILRWRQDGALTITQLLARLDRRPSKRPKYSSTALRTIQPEMRQSAIFVKGPIQQDAKLNVRYAKLSTVEASLSIRYNTQQQVDAYPSFLNWQTLNTVKSSLDIRYNQEDATRYQEIQDLKAIVNTLSIVTEVVMATASVSDNNSNRRRRRGERESDII